VGSPAVVPAFELRAQGREVIKAFDDRHYADSQANVPRIGRSCWLSLLPT
jgi:hypothetical protein